MKRGSVKRRVVAVSRRIAARESHFSAYHSMQETRNLTSDLERNLAAHMETPASWGILRRETGGRDDDVRRCSGKPRYRR